jgi:hypothetical protein
MKLFKQIKFILFPIIFCFCGCELFVIQGKKIVIEEQSAYTQKTPVGTVMIFLNELGNDNILAASELLIKPDGKLLNAVEKYDATSELSRMRRFMEGKKIIHQKLDTVAGVINITLELDYKSKAIFSTVEKDHLFYILNYSKESSD